MGSIVLGALGAEQFKTAIRDKRQCLVAGNVRSRRLNKHNAYYRGELHVNVKICLSQFLN